MRRLACLALAAGLALPLAVAPALAQNFVKPNLQKVPPRPMPKASKDPADSPAGVYVLDPMQASVLLRAENGGGFVYSVFRMTDVSGALNWDPARLEDSKLNVKIGTASLQTNVPGLTEELTGANFLASDQFHEATFVSTGIKRTGPTTGEVTGDLTLHGVTRPVTLTVDLVGAGRALQGPALGFHGRGLIKRSDFKVGPASPVIGDEIEILLDVQFNKAA
jgi:polyisoprenoid-binding protein YceI